MADKPNLVHVQIFGQTYAVKAGTDPAYVEKLAAFVDGQMTEVSRGSGAVDSVRVAVLAALNIADEVLPPARGEGARGRRPRHPGGGPGEGAGGGARRVTPCAPGLSLEGRPVIIVRGSPALFVMAS